MIYKLIEPPEYIDTSGSKRTIIKIVVTIIVTVLTFSLSIAPFLPDKGIYYDAYTDNNGYISPEDKQTAERYYRKNWEESFGAGCGVCLFGAFVFGLITLGVLSIFLPNERNIENINHFNDYYKFPTNRFHAAFINETHKIPVVPMIIWKNENEVHMSANNYKNDFGKVIIPFENIVFFVRDGDFYTKTEISRNGRIIGGLIAGPTGFLTGTNTSAETIEVDNRQTILYLENDGNEETWFFDSETYNSLMQIIPQFEYKKVVSKPKNNDVAPTSASKSDNLEQIKKLKELLDIGAISQDEFDSKKQELLNKI